MSRGFVTALFFVLFVVIVSLLSLTLYQRYARTGAYREIYEGKILDKWTTVRESQLGSRYERRLLVETKNKDRLVVAVSENDYARVQTGMWVRKRGADIEFFSSEPQDSPAAANSSANQQPSIQR